MLTVGLTGGIGSGKSEVARLLESHGAVVIDADRIAREVVEPGTRGFGAVVEAFGSAVLLPDGTLDRKRLGAVVFADEAARQRLNAIVHPLVAERTAELVAQAPPDAVVVLDVPLLVEANLASGCDLVVVVDVSTPTQVDRLTRFRGMTGEEALARIVVQATREERRAAAGVVIDNDGDRAHLREQVQRLWERIGAAMGYT